jgi:hypothetical protein
MSKSLRLAVVAMLAVCLTRSAVASPVTPNWLRSDPYTTYQAWDIFSDASAAGINAPNSPNVPFGAVVDGAPHNPNGTANVLDTSGQSFVTGGGNLYSPTAATHIRLTSPEYHLGAGYVTTVLFQTRTQGDELIYSGAEGFRLTYSDGSGSHVVMPVSGAELNRQALGGFGGDLVDYGALFQIPASPAEFTISVDAADVSVSFDRSSIDTIVTRANADSPLLEGMNPTIGYVSQAVPEPAALGALALAGGLLRVRGRRRIRIER